MLWKKERAGSDLKRLKKAAPVPPARWRVPLTGQFQSWEKRREEEKIFSFGIHLYTIAQAHTLTNTPHTHTHFCEEKMIFVKHMLQWDQL